MPPKDDLLFVGHMLDSAKKAMALVSGKTVEEYYAEDALRYALAHLIQTIGEAARRVEDEYRNAHPEIPWREVVGMRHKIVHDYMEVDEDIVWSAVTDDLPNLVAKLELLVSTG